MRPLLLSFLVFPLLAQSPHFSPTEAMWAEWRRQVPAFSAKEIENMEEPDRARLELSVRRAQGIGAPSLLPPEMDAPTESLWLEKAAQAATPQERVDAFNFLNRLKSPGAADAFADLPADGFDAWPRHVRLEGQFTAATLNARGTPKAEAVASLWRAYTGSVPTDPARAMVSWLRLHLAGIEAERPEPIEATPHAILALMDAWNRAPWAKRSESLPTGRLELGASSAFWTFLGLKPPSEVTLARAHVGIMSRLAEGVPERAGMDWQQTIGAPWLLDRDSLVRWYGFQSLARFGALTPEISKALDTVTNDKNLSPLLRATLLPALYVHRPKIAPKWRDSLLTGADPVARALAVEQLKEMPKNMDALIKRIWHDEEYDSVQSLMKAMSQWGLTQSVHSALLDKFLSHPSWTAKLDAWRELKKLGVDAPWPKTQRPANIDQSILVLAQEFLAKGEPVRVCVDFRDAGSVVMVLDPKNAPMNTANLALLARKGFFDGRRVPRIVPDFVVQMGSPCDTMDGGPGYNVRCENSLDWYGPGSVGMALSGMDTGGCQFFFTLNATPHLTGRYTRVGELEDLDGAMKVLESLELGAVIERVTVM